MLAALSRPQDLAAYRTLLAHMVLPVHGWVLLQVVPAGGKTPLNALETSGYTVAELSALVGPDFALHAQVDYAEVDAEGSEQPRLYALFRRQADPQGTFRR